jgi:preprotein translocase subunit YajC
MNPASGGIFVILATALSPGGIGSALTATLLADGAAPGGSPGGFLAGGNMLLIVVMIGIFYFLLIRPQRQREREHQDWLKTLKKDDEVVTSGGIWGKVKGFSEKSPYVTLELQEKVRVRVLRSAITGKAPGNNDEASTEQPKQ